jgi:HAD superfamily hydrolase (TIGR01509 family)
MAAAGFGVTEAQFAASFGQRNDAIIPAWIGDRATPDLVRELGDAKEALYRTLITAEGIAPLPGAADWVRRLHDDGWRQAIASSAPKLNVELMARVLGFGDLLDALIGAEDVRNGKPDPEVFLTAAAALGVPPERCVVVEDAAAGIEGALRAGMRSIGVAGDATSAATVSVESLDRLPSDAFDRLMEKRPLENDL